MTTPIIPQVDYTSKDYASLKTSMLDFASRTFPEWRGRSEGDFGVVLVELFAYMGDILSYYGDRIAGEAYLETATQRSSILNIAGLLGYTPANAIAATGTVTFVSQSAQIDPVVIPAGTKVVTDFIQKFDSPIFYETVSAVTLPGSGGTITAAVIQGETQGDTAITVNVGTPYEETLLATNLGASDGSFDQLIPIPGSPVIEGSVRFFSTSTDVAGATIFIEWQEFESIIDAGSADRAFALQTDENNVTNVVLGDSVSGVIPPAGSTLFVSYRLGGGARGNIPANLLTDIVSAVPGATIQSSSAMTGGSDPESNEQIRANAPKAFRTQNRAVTLEDYSDLALGVTSVSKAAAVANSFTNITVFIIGPNGTTASQGLKDAVSSYLSDKKMAGSTVTVSAASVVLVNIGKIAAPTVLGVNAAYRRADVSANVTKAIKNFLDLPNVDFGQRVSLSDIYKVIASVPGVDYANIAMLARSDASQSGTADIQLREWEVPAAGDIIINAVGGLS